MTTRPVAGMPRAYRFPDATRFSLGNGVRVIVAPVHRVPLVTVELVIDAGAARDDAAHAGLAGLTARGLAEGTRVLDGVALTREFESLGSALFADADWDHALLHATVTPDRLTRCAGLLRQVLMEPSFPPRGLQRLRGERLAELEQERAEPRALADRCFASGLFAPASRFSVARDGDERTVQALTDAAVREFHHARYGAGALTLIITGDITVGAAREVIEREFGGVAATPAAPENAGSETIRGRRVLVVDKKDAPQSELRVGHRGVPRGHPDYFALVLMNAILGGLFSSRINLNLRERNGFTYGARSAFDWRRTAGPFCIEAAVRTEVTGAATREILHEVESIRAEGVRDDELSLATDYLTGVFPLRYETTTATADALALAEVYGLGPDYFDRYRDRVRAVTAADVHRVAREHLHPEDMLVTAVGDAAAIRGLLDELSLGPLRVESPAAGDTA